MNIRTLFGTDGIRGVAGQYPLDANTVYRTGLCLTRYLNQHCDRPKVLIARDTRRSGPRIEALLRRTVEEAGGLLTALKVLEIPIREQKDISDSCRPVKRYPQILVNVPVRR